MDLPPQQPPQNGLDEQPPPPDPPAADDRAQRLAERERMRLALEVQQLQNQLQAERERPRPPQVLSAAAIGGELPKFNGDPSSGVTFNSFLQDYKLAADSLGLTDEMSALALGRCLEGHAKQKYKDLVRAEPQLREDLRILTRRLTEYFTELGGGRRYGSASFYARKQLPGETPTTYYAELKKLSKEAYPDDNDPMPDTLLLERFMRGLKLSVRRNVITREPRTSEAALREAVKVQAQRDFLADEEDEHTVAAVQVQEDMQKQMEKMTLSINELTAQLAKPSETPTDKRENWPRPERHFPPQPPMWGPQSAPQWRQPPPQWRRQQPMWRQPQSQRPRFRRQGYNQAAEQRCFNCNQYGHFRASCPEKSRMTPNYRRVNQVSEEEDHRRTSSGGSTASHAYLYLAVICMLLPISADAQRTMVCHTATSGQLFALPKPMECNFSTNGLTDTPVPMKLALFKHNLHKYDVPGWLCRGVKQTAKLLTYLFGDEHLSSFGSEEVFISTTECQDLVKNKTSTYGTLTEKKSGTWSTNNRLNWKTPSWGVPQCCKWHHYEATNIFVMPARVYKRHDFPGFQSSAADISACPSYFAGSCQLGTKALVWTPDAMANCKYTFYQTMRGSWMMNAWVSTDGTLALTHRSNQTDEDCGYHLNISDQQIPFRIIQPRIRRETTEPPPPSPEPQSPGNGLVMADQLAGQLQALYLRTQKDTNQAFQMTLRTVCDDMKSAAMLLRITATSRPTETVRALLNDSLLFGRAGNGIIEVWRCLPISLEDLTFQKQLESCTQEIPVSFKIHNSTQSGYLDPVTLIISHTSHPADCDQSNFTPVRMYRKIFLFNRRNGTMIPALRINRLRVLNYHHNEVHRELTDQLIFRPVTMYSWEEMEPSEDLNALLQTTAAQAEVLSWLGSQTANQGDTEEVARNLAENIVTKGMMSIVSILQSPFHVWVLLTCTFVSVAILWAAARKIRSSTHITKDNILPIFRKRRVRKRRTRGKTSIEEVPMPTLRQIPVNSEEEEEEAIESLVERTLNTSVGLICSVQGDSHSIILLIRVGNKTGRFLFDSGSALTLVSQKFFNTLGLSKSPTTCPKAVSVTGAPIQFAGEATIDMNIGDLNFPHNFRIFPGCAQDGILGMDCIKKWGPVMLDAAGRRLKIGDTFVPIEHSRTPPIRMRATANAEIPARSVAIIYGRSSIPLVPGQNLIFEQDHFRHDDFISPRTLLSSADQMPIRVINPASHSTFIHQNQKLGEVEPVAEVRNRCPEESGATSNYDPLSQLNLESSLLEDNQEAELKELLRKYDHLFAKDETQLPGTKVVKHVINLTHERPIKQKVYRVPVSLRKALDEKLDTLLDAGIISPSCSPYASPLVLVRKPDGSIKPCVDFRRLNDITVPDSHPLPRIDKSLEVMAGAKFLSTLDLHSGYLQLPMEEESKKYTAFTTSRGLFHWNFLPFGLRNSPATFSRLMQFVLSGLLFESSILYMDDVLVCSKTWEDHLKHLEQIFRRLDHYNLRLKMKKCNFARSSLPFLGYLITTDGVRPDPDNVKRLIQLPPPTNVTQTRSFLGLANYYRRFISGFADIARPLYNLTKRENRFVWSRECQSAFSDLKLKLTTSPMLVYPKFDRPFCLSTDASNKGSGAVLSQVHDGHEKPIAYFSHKFNTAETRYETVEQELYSIVLALKHWKHYLYGHQVEVYSDQKSLSWGIRQSDSPRMMRWIQQLAEFDIKIYYRPGRKNTVADFLSRMEPFPGSQLIYAVKKSEAPVEVQAVYGLHLGRHENDYFREQQKADTKLVEILEKLKDPGNTEERIWKNFKIDSNGCLLRRAEPGTVQFVVPTHLRTRIMEELHDSTWGAHLGVARTYEKIIQKYWWDGVKLDVENWVQSCIGCATRKADTRPTRGELQPIHASAPWQTLVIDLVGPLPISSRGNKWILVMMDRFTKWPECVALRTPTATNVARALITYIITRHGVPIYVQSDRGAQFTSQVFSEVSNLMGMKQKLSCAYRPQTQGLIERWNRTMMQMLRQFVASDQKDWDQYLDLVMFAYRTSVHSSTGYTPFQLLYGREAKLPTHLMNDDRETFEGESTYVENLRRKLKTAYDTAQDANWKASDTQKKQFDKQINPSNLKAGEHVFLKRPTPVAGLSPKLQPKYKGPYLLTCILGKNGLITPTSPGRAKSVWVHLDHLRRANVRNLAEYDWPEENEEGDVMNQNEAEAGQSAERQRDEEEEEEVVVAPRYNLRSRQH